MVIESIVGPISASRRPWMMIFIGILYSSIGLFLANWVFSEYASIVMVFFTVLACAPLMYRAIKVEEKFDLTADDEKSMLLHHAKALSFMMYLFVGITIGFVFWYLILPSDMATASFSIQTDTINRINGYATGPAVSSFSVFSQILFNNLKVMIFCILFSLTYGLGAIFILVWNASVIAAAIGNFIREQMSGYATSLGLATIGAYLHVTSFGFLRYAIHGIPEILAYFMAGLAGGIISVAIIRHDFGTKKFERIIIDSSDLLILAIVILVIAAGIEAFITPLLFL